MKEIINLYLVNTPKILDHILSDREKGKVSAVTAIRGYGK